MHHKNYNGNKERNILSYCFGNINMETLWYIMVQLLLIAFK